MRFTPKRSVVIAAVCLLAGGAAGVSVPAMASNTSAHRNANVPNVTLDFSGTNDEQAVANTVGVAFGGNARVKDGGGNVIGTAYDLCDKDSISPTSTTAFCAGEIVFNDGSQVSFNVVFPIPNAASNYPNVFQGVINGGTKAYEGVTGEAEFTAKSPGVYDLQFN
ncbi:hypothetical protein GCM10009665_43860 [Kitasatospora nipponensis]|uniref:Uncharacterized protein n=1 Tax=Kitasatospora nipponensis TaxID=258049 RepID=A0ABN1WLC6_9ACTN